MGTTPVPPPPKRGSFPLKTPRKESPRGDEQDAERFVVLRGFYAKNDGDESVVFSNTDGPTGRSRPSCGAHTALAGNIKTQLDKKKVGKGASFQTICTSIESPLKTMQDDGLGLRFHASFLVFSRSDVSDDERISRCPLTSFAAPTTQKSAVSRRNWPLKTPQACLA